MYWFVRIYYDDLNTTVDKALPYDASDYDSDVMKDMIFDSDAIKVLGKIPYLIGKKYELYKKDDTNPCQDCSTNCSRGRKPCATAQEYIDNGYRHKEKLAYSSFKD